MHTNRVTVAFVFCRPTKCAQQVDGMLPAVVGITSEARCDDSIECAWNVRTLGVWPRIRKDSGDLGCGGRAFERPLARRHLEQQRSECEYVRTAIRSGPLQLLGRHVRDGS